MFTAALRKNNSGSSRYVQEVAPTGTVQTSAAGEPAEQRVGAVAGVAGLNVQMLGVKSLMVTGPNWNRRQSGVSETEPKDQVGGLVPLLLRKTDSIFAPSVPLAIKDTKKVWPV